jgi:ribosomal-protein-alanine N-acetyltransferase
MQIETPALSALAVALLEHYNRVMSNAKPSASGRVVLVDLTEDDLLTTRRWFLESRPATQTCRPIVPETDGEAIQRFHERAQDETRYEFAIRSVDTDQLIGKISYFDLNVRNRSVEFGISLHLESRGQGYASEALGLLLEHLFVHLGLNKVMAQTGEFNAPSIALLRRFGFKEDGRLREHHELDGVLHDDLLFSLLVVEYLRHCENPSSCSGMRNDKHSIENE